MVQPFRDDLTAAEGHLGEIGGAIDNLVGDVDRLQAKILELENSPDKVTDADQARITAIVNMVGSIKGNLKALDDKAGGPPVVDPPIDPPPPPIDPPVDPMAGNRRR